MQEPQTFLMPDYYSDFTCKMGACRRACCVGWPITVSMKNYFTLLGIDCSSNLRRRLDCALHLTHRPSEYEYAQFSPRWDGDCPLRMEDGSCTIHAELGEEPLPDVCRLYPRGIRKREKGDFEISCANSCEKTIELFLHRTEPIGFIKSPLAIALPPLAEPKPCPGREAAISLLQDRTRSLSRRLAALGGIAEQAGGDSLSYGIRFAEEMVALLDSRSDSIRDYGERALQNLAFGEADNKADENYRRLKAKFEADHPNHAILFEHLLVNHIFFTEFDAKSRTEFDTLCTIYSLLRFLCVGLAEAVTEDDALVDLLAAAFRLIDHTDFNRTSAAVLKQTGWASPNAAEKTLRALISL